MEVIIPETADVVGIPDVVGAEQLEELYSSKIWMGKSGDSRIRFDSPHTMVAPFIDKLERHLQGQYQLHVEASHPSANRNEDDGEINTAFGRVMVEARMISDAPYTGAVGMVWAFDLGKPEVIVYQGHNVVACINLTIFRGEQVFRGDYLTQADHAQRVLGTYTETVGQDIDHFTDTVDRLQNRHYSSDRLNEQLGDILTKVLTTPSIGTAALNSAVKMLHDPNSLYALDSDGGTTAWNLLNALTAYGPKSYVNVRPLKTLQMAELFIN